MALDSCTNLLTQFNFFGGDFCPTPPLVSINNYTRNPTGPLESTNTYVAEHLLREADDEDPADFFRRYQGGITITYRDPPFSVCGCSSNDQTCRESFSCLTDSLGDMCPTYLESDDCFSQQSCENSDLQCKDFSICDDTLPGCYNVDGASANNIKRLFCNNSNERPIGKTYLTQNQSIGVTVWYNNQVRTVNSS